VNDRIAELAALIADRIPALIEEARDQINEAINAAMEDAQERENGKAVLSLAITAKWDLDGNAVVISMPVAVRRKFEVTAALEDPNQERLPFVEAVEDRDGDPMPPKMGKAVGLMVQRLKAQGFKVTENAALKTGGAHE
jgi:hypothetical protein